MLLSTIVSALSILDAVALLSKTKAQAYDWPKYSDLTPIKLKVKMENQKVQLQKMDATVQKLAANASGSFDIKTGKFDVPISLSLADFASSLEGCNLIDEKWRKRIVPLRCKGGLDKIGPTTCLPDIKLIGKLIEDQYKDKAKAKGKEKGKELEQKAKEKLTEKLGEEKVKELKDSFKGLFKKK